MACNLCARLQEELALNKSMLAKQCDRAMELESENSRLKLERRQTPLIDHSYSHGCLDGGVWIVTNQAKVFTTEVIDRIDGLINNL